jgi:hypothetical protein
MAHDEIVKEANELLRCGFDEVDSSWRLYAVIHPVPNFNIIGARRTRLDDTLLPNGVDNLDTYALKISFSKQEIDSGEWRKRMRNVGRGSALKFNEVFWGAAGKKRDDLVVEVAFRNGQQYPIAELCDQDVPDTFTFRLYHDCGVNVVAQSTV